MTRSVIAVVGAVVVLAASGCAPDGPVESVSTATVTTTPDPETSPTPRPWEEVFADAEPATVRITTLSCDDGPGAGSGFVVGEDAVVTAAHVVAGARSVAVQTTDGSTHAAEPVGISLDTDTALLRLTEPLEVTPLELAAAVPGRGSALAALGYPFGTYEQRIADGIVTGLPQPVEYEDQHVERAFLTNAATNEGNSGGPVVDDTGRVIGIVSGGMTWDSDLDPVEGTNYVVPVDDVRAGVDRWAGLDESVAENCGDDVESADPPWDLENPPWDPDEWDGSVNLAVQPDTEVAGMVGQLLYMHGTAINRAEYESAFELFTPQAQGNLGGLEEWSAGVEDSYWAAVDVIEVRSDPGGDVVTASAALRTLQPESEDATECSVWVLDYELHAVDGVLAIHKAKGERPTPC